MFCVLKSGRESRKPRPSPQVAAIDSADSRNRYGENRGAALFCTAKAAIGISRNRHYRDVVKEEGG